MTIPTRNSNKIQCNLITLYRKVLIVCTNYARNKNLSHANCVQLIRLKIIRLHIKIVQTPCIENNARANRPRVRLVVYDLLLLPIVYFTDDVKNFMISITTDAAP